MVRLSYFLKQTIRNFFRGGNTSFQSLFMMSVSLFLLGAFFWASRQVDRTLKRWEGEAPIIIYLKDGLTEKQIQSFIGELKKNHRIYAVKEISPELALARLGKSLGKKKSLLQGVQSMLFPTSLELTLYPDYKKPDSIVKIAKSYEQHKQIQQIDYGREWYLPLWQVSRWLRLLFWGSSLLVLFAVSFMSAGTVRMSLVLHQEEISIMRMVGATEAFVRTPYYMEGFFSGLVAAGSALVALYVGFIWLSHSFGSNFQRFTALKLQFFSESDCMYFLFGGALAGLFGGLWVFRSNKETM